MSTIYLETFIKAPIERCFDLSLSVDIHRNSVSHTHERAIAGVTSGVMKLNDTVTWEAVHFGIRQHLTTKITEYERPVHFVDEMLKGPFKEIHHIHEFVESDGSTLMIDRFSFQAPLGLAGRLAEVLVLRRYMRSLLITRNNYIKKAAEGQA
ncbi:cell division protein [Ktedonosporobacter rubrisoli]|uniref:Cell division protein n=1 Tax=Ktedonosporobacter rubrisoli TaxID=2509675 RepID=A0A4P6JZZ1_KTERU|nr:SRPBCC family protein [Ktedonosporobacter rubrisoli]QBD81417.1 cell division protein [Ktedonosporobacter rubrisoli]